MESDNQLRKYNPEHTPYIFWDDVKWPEEEKNEEDNHDYLINSEGD